MKKVIYLPVHVEQKNEKQYLQVPFMVPEDVTRIDIEYSYPRFKVENTEYGEKKTEINIIDLGLHGPNNDFIGTSGSDRRHIWVSESNTSLGYSARDTVAGEWKILLGAYKVQPEGVDVEYTITFTMKERKLYFGDTHMHTLASDGNMSVPELAQTAKKIGLDFIFTTDHNNYAQNYETHSTEGITVIPGSEWTHYSGHANFYGLQRPVKSPLPVNSKEEAMSVWKEAQDNGAVFSLNHPFCPFCGWHWGFDFPYDMIEIWNGSLFPEANVKALVWWHKQLMDGKKIPIVCGSDFHRLEPFRLIGQPALGLYSYSCNPKDIIDAMKNGRSFVAYSPSGAKIFAQAGDAILGETAQKGEKINVTYSDLSKGDCVRFITDKGIEEWICEDNFSQIDKAYSSEDILFGRFEVYRPASPYGMSQPILISNPIYFEE